MNNKRGGAGGVVLLVLILMIASAVGGAYLYRMLDGKAAVNDALKAVEDVDISDYDTPEQQIIQGYIDDTTKDLQTAKTRKEVYEIISDFISDVDRVQTKKDKELEQALKDAEDARKKYEQGSDDRYNNDSNSGSTNSTNNNNNSNDSESGGYKSNELNNADDGKEENGFLGSLLGGLSSGARD